MSISLEMLASNYKLLKEADPSHELLRFIQEITREQILLTQDPDLQKEFLARFAEGRTDAPASEVEVRYSLALADARTAVRLAALPKITHTASDF